VFLIAEIDKKRFAGHARIINKESLTRCSICELTGLVCDPCSRFSVAQIQCVVCGDSVTLDACAPV